MANLAARLPMSQPGTLFGIPLNTFRDRGLQQKALMVAGIALVAWIVIPFATSPKLMFVFSEGMRSFASLYWPIIAAAAYFLVALAPQNIVQNIPPLVMKWLPFGTAFASILVLEGFIFRYLAGDSAAMWMANIGYPLLLFGFLARLSDPGDQIARIVIAVGAGFMLIPFFVFTFDVGFADKKAFTIIHNLLQILVFLVAVASAVLVVKPDKVPALRGVDAFAPLLAAILVAWIPLKIILLFLGDLIHGGSAVTALFILLHVVCALVAYWGILLLTAPDAYDEIKRIMAGQAGFQGNPYAQQPGQPGQQPGQFGQQPGQFGQQPGQFGQQPGQFGQQPGQFGQQPGQPPGQFGPPPGQAPGQFGPPPGQFGPPPGQPPGQFGPPPGQPPQQAGFPPQGPPPGAYPPPGAPGAPPMAGPPPGGFPPPGGPPGGFPPPGPGGPPPPVAGGPPPAAPSGAPPPGRPPSGGGFPPGSGQGGQGGGGFGGPPPA